LADAGRSLVTNRAMITKVYFPRLTIPLSSVLGGIVDFFDRFRRVIRDDVVLPLEGHFQYLDITIFPAPGIDYFIGVLVYGCQL